MLRRSPAPEEIDAWVLGLSSQSVSPYAVTRAFVESDECQRMNRVKTHAAPGHFYSPIVNPAEGHARLVRAEAEAFSDSLPGLEINRGLMIDTWNRLLPFLTDAPFESSPGKGLKFGYDNPAYSWGDASVLHAMLRLYRPNRIVEIGCGWSSACIFDTVSRYLDPTCELTFIEPFPQLLRELLNNVTPNTRIFESKVQETGRDNLKNFVRETFFLLIRVTFCAPAVTCISSCLRSYLCSLRAFWFISTIYSGHSNIRGPGSWTRIVPGTRHMPSAHFSRITTNGGCSFSTTIL